MKPDFQNKRYKIWVYRLEEIFICETNISPILRRYHSALSIWRHAHKLARTWGAKQTKIGKKKEKNSRNEYWKQMVGEN